MPAKPHAKPSTTTAAVLPSQLPGVLAAAGTAQTGLATGARASPFVATRRCGPSRSATGDSRLEEGQRASPLSLALAGPQRDAVGPASEDDHGHPLPQPPPVELPTAPRKGTRAALSAGLRILLLLVFFVGVVAMVMVENAIDAREKERQAAAEARKEASLAEATRVHLAEIEAKGKTLLAVAKTWPLRPENERDLSTNGHSNETSRLVNYAMRSLSSVAVQFAATVVYNYLPPTVTDFYLKTDVKGITGAFFYGLVFRVDQDHKRYYELVVNNQYYWLYIATDFAKRYLFSLDLHCRLETDRPGKHFGNPRPRPRDRRLHQRSGSRRSLRRVLCTSGAAGSPRLRRGRSTNDPPVLASRTAPGSDRRRRIGNHSAARPLGSGRPLRKRKRRRCYFPQYGDAPASGRIGGGRAVARDPGAGRIWLAHCYGMVGAGRGDTLDASGTDSMS